MALRIAKIDHETKTITYEEVPDEPSLTFASSFEALSGLGLREGMVVEGDGIDEYGMFINPRRVR